MLAEVQDAFSATVVDLALCWGGGRGCLATRALTEAAMGDPGFADRLTRRFDVIELGLADRIARAGLDEAAHGEPLLRSPGCWWRRSEG